MTRIKICGITNTDDGLAAVDYGADALGFILVPDTPRFVRPEAYEPILQRMLPFVTTVAVLKRLEDSGSDLPLKEFGAIQFYRDDRAMPIGSNCKHIRAFSIKDENSLDLIDAYLQRERPDALLLDAYHKDKLGGSGETFNWELALEVKLRFALPVMLAGGLTPENVEDAIATVRPFAVDVSSGVEAEPGRKDHRRLKEFIRAVRRADSSP